MCMPATKKHHVQLICLSFTVYRKICIEAAFRRCKKFNQLYVFTDNCIPCCLLGGCNKWELSVLLLKEPIYILYLSIQMKFSGSAGK